MTQESPTRGPHCGGSNDVWTARLRAGNPDQPSLSRAASDHRAVAFDAFGTLLRITDPRYPWQQIARAGSGFKIDPRCQAGTLAEFAAACAVDWNPVWGDDLAAELASIRLYDDARSTLAALREAGFSLAVVSNLALPYVRPVHLALRDQVDAEVYSCDVGSVKPQPAIFGAVCVALDMPPHRILMVGDSLHSDVEGACGFGMPALHLVRDRSEAKDGEITSLAQLLDILGQ